MLGPIHTINAFTPLLLAGKTKKCIVISSGMGAHKYVGKVGSTGAVGYAISKAALNLAAAKFAARFKSDGLIVLSISPGLVKTMQGRESAFVCFQVL